MMMIMRLCLIVLAIATTLLTNGEARSLRLGRTAESVTKGATDSEERKFMIHTVVADAAKAAAKVEKVQPVKLSVKDTLLNALAKLLPDTSNRRHVYSNGRWKTESYF
ncbi:Putative RxLR effector [Phytophthora palmivora]|uniref:RxLR effector n=1 Tax=Phytophthora palmivora TaxID=4796 RepID=A0A2P4WYA0_9STRA|nr:Putative RxLR effector [Phytophthora palmivora]